MLDAFVGGVRRIVGPDTFMGGREASMCGPQAWATGQRRVRGRGGRGCMREDVRTGMPACTSSCMYTCTGLWWWVVVAVWVGWVTGTAVRDGGKAVRDHARRRGWG